MAAARHVPTGRDRSNGLLAVLPSVLRFQKKKSRPITELRLNLPLQHTQNASLNQARSLRLRIQLAVNDSCINTAPYKSSPAARQDDTLLAHLSDQSSAFE